MNVHRDPFDVMLVEEPRQTFDTLSERPVASAASVPLLATASIACFHGFDLDNCPLVSGLPGLPDEIVPTRTTVALSSSQIGCPTVLVFEDGDVRRPIVIGVLQKTVLRDPPEPARTRTAITADDDRFVIAAEREIVLCCGDASITLTRAGKVLIKGRYVLSRSTGYNRIKGAAVDIN